MRPEYLPPLIIPKRRTRTPILVATCPRRQEQEKQQQQQQQDEEEKEQEQQPGQRPLPIFRPSYRTPPATLPATAFPNPPPERKPDDIDDIEAFSFYNPCLLPPSPVAPPFETRSYTDPSHGIPPLEPAPAPPLPDYSPQRWRQRQRQRQEGDPLPPRPRPGSAQPGLRRSTQPLNRDYRRRGGNRAAASVPPPPFRPPRTPPPARPDPELPPSPFSIQRSPSRLYARPPLRRGGPRPGAGPGTGPAAQQQQQQQQQQKHQISLPRWDTCGPPGFDASRPPSPVVAAHRRPAKPPVEWDAKSMSSSVYSMYTDDVVQSPYYSHSHNNNDDDDNDNNLYDDDDDDDDGSSTPGSWGRRDGGAYVNVTPCLAVRPPGQEGRRGGGGGGEGGYKEKEEAALRDLWGVIDELLGPDRRLGDYDAMSITSSMNGEMAAAAAASAAGYHSRPSAPRASHSNRESRQSGVSGEGAWWRAVRQGLLLS
ncbi:hypothetical protein MYCTH_2128634 [Thermothelomyces thermophilus ATCC 42464]|uniref:Uncharacterized protein n=1 Tax=Thermothelomyces thermophilus (strain ATCC 42464 / BCRC 31852 / DSM 1799) TaxID=573729 RepID=G2QIT8_THET4|nr:uncharacterized protein MYCTH_2128634 [Thermothelomyces thermophilus ATCC 42464]AEO59566.1 hypothetical protein MYCTH_2128634 [Thermothelomyces thermophilus ATCC 42464]